MTETLPMAAKTPLAEAYAEAKAADPGARARDIADRLGVSEGALAEARRGAGVARLAFRGPEFARLVAALPALGRMMALTRNEAAVHEVTGGIDGTDTMGAMGQVTGEIDLRLFFRHWHAGYAVAEETRSGLRHSLQVFDAAGTAVLKVYAVEGTDMGVWERLVEGNLDASTALTAFAPRAVPAPDRPDGEIDRARLRELWTGLEHSHGFQGMLREVGAGRLQALRLAGEDLAREVDAGSVARMLEGAAEAGVPIMCFVGNPGCIQIFSGPVARIAPMGPWLNVLDPGFNLHLRTDRVAGVWAVTKPTSERGPITSLELFDAEGTLVCQFFGVRPPGQPEREAWRALVGRATGAGSTGAGA